MLLYFACNEFFIYCIYFLFLCTSVKTSCQDFSPSALPVGGVGEPKIFLLGPEPAFGVLGQIL
jgi:hypothetical protein